MHLEACVWNSSKVHINLAFYKHSYKVWLGGFAKSDSTFCAGCHLVCSVGEASFCFDKVWSLVAPLRLTKLNSG